MVLLVYGSPPYGSQQPPPKQRDRPSAEENVPKEVDAEKWKNRRRLHQRIW